jgi:hypothetical protein
MHIAVPVPGDVVWIRQRRWRVERARRDRNVLRLDVRNRDERLTFLAPFDRPAAIARRERTSRVRAAHAMARLAHLVSRTFTWSTLMSARDADIDILPYQLEPALAMLAGARRVLLADEVGLGKTIQAGLAIAEMHRRSPGARTLVLVPAALRDQWVDELGRRFRLQCHAADRQRLDEHARHGLHGDDPWRRPGVWIASFDFLKQRHVMDGLPIEPWDLLILDEVHVVCGDSERHEACTELAQRARQVMLISATPHTGEDARFARLMNLGRLNDADMAPVMVRRTRRDVGFDLPRNVRWHRIRPAKPELALFQALGEFEAAALQTAARVHREAAILLLAVFRKRALSTIRALRISLDRRLAWLGDGQRAADFDWLQPRLAFEDDTDEADETDREALTADIGLRSAAERSWLRRLRGLAEAAGRCESKVSYVTTLISRAREPVVVFTEFRHSLEVLQRRLQTTSAVAVLHGGLTPAAARSFPVRRRHRSSRHRCGRTGTEPAGPHEVGDHPRAALESAEARATLRTGRSNRPVEARAFHGDRRAACVRDGRSRAAGAAHAGRPPDVRGRRHEPRRAGRGRRRRSTLRAWRARRTGGGWQARLRAFGASSRQARADVPQVDPARLRDRATAAR